MQQGRGLGYLGEGCCLWQAEFERFTWACPIKPRELSFVLLWVCFGFTLLCFLRGMSSTSSLGTENGQDPEGSGSFHEVSSLALLGP